MADSHDRHDQSERRDRAEGNRRPPSDTASQRRRITWLIMVVFAAGFVLLGRLALWQLVPRPDVVSYGLAGNKRPNTIPAARGNILDRHGHYLAASTVEYKIAVSPRLLSEDQREQLTPQLAALLERDPDDVADLLSRQGSEYIVLGTGLPPAVGQAFEALDEGAFAIETDFRRVYPDGAMATHVLGFVDYEGQAHYGLEQRYDRQLAGVAGQWYGIRDPWGKQLLVSLGGYQPAQDGADLKLTLDRNIQHMAETVLREGIARYDARAGSIIVLDPRTGAILAMANYPSYDPGRYWDVEGPEVYINTSISALYEPGSVLKPLTLAAGLEARVIHPHSTYDDRGEIIVGDQRIWNSDEAAYGQTTMTELLARSLNVGAAHVANLLGPTRFYEMIRRFGFSEATGVDLALEERGIMRVPGEPAWHMSDLGTNSFGQGIAVTPLQLVAAYAALANDGVLMRPYIVSEIHRSDGSIETHQPFRVRQVISPEVADQITRLMVDAVEMGMQKATVEGYRLAGKSGTSGIPSARGYDSSDTIASFVGFGPAEEPRLVVLVKFDRPIESRWGLEVAAPEFSRMVEMLTDYWAIPPETQFAQRDPGRRTP